MKKEIVISDASGETLTGKNYLHVSGSLVLVRANGSLVTVALPESDYTLQELSDLVKEAK